MSIDHNDQIQCWRSKLSTTLGEDCVEALRQISTCEEVVGLSALIVPMAGSSDDEIRMWASEALESAVQPDSSELRPLIELLERSTDSEVCYWAATMLGRLGSNGGAAAHALEGCVRESMYLPARERATWALSQIGPAAKVAIKTLEEASQTAPPRLQRLATQTLDIIRQTLQAAPPSTPNRSSNEAAA